MTPKVASLSQVVFTIVNDFQFVSEWKDLKSALSPSANHAWYVTVVTRLRKDSAVSGLSSVALQWSEHTD